MVEINTQTLYPTKSRKKTAKKIDRLVYPDDDYPHGRQGPGAVMVMAFYISRKSIGRDIRLSTL